VNNVPKFRRIEGGSTATKLTAAEARQLVERARRQVRHGTGFSSATVAILEALLFKLTNRATGQCWPSVPTIAAAARVSVDTVKRALKQLEAVGLVKRAARWAVWVVEGVAVRVRTSSSYSFGTFGSHERGVSAKCAGNTEDKDNKHIRHISSLREGLARQAQVAIDWARRLESDARRSVAQQLAILARG
jgi:hypothetical protein